MPKPRSSGSATTVATRRGSKPGETSSLFGLISSCQFFWITTTPLVRRVKGDMRAGRPENETTRRKDPARERASDAATLARAAAVMRNRRHVADRGNGETGGLQCAQSRFAARTGTRHLDLKGTHAVLGRLATGILRSHLRSIGGRLAGALEAHHAGGGPRDRVTLRIGDGDHGVVERSVHMRDARNDVLAFAAAYAGGILGHVSICPSGAPVIPGARENAARSSPVRRLAHRSGLLLLAGDRLRLALAGAGVGMRTLAADRQVAAVTQAAIDTEIHQPLDVHRHFAAQITFHDIIAVDGLADHQHFLIGELVDTALDRNRRLGTDLLGLLGTDAMNVLQRNDDALVCRNIDACDAGHFTSPCRLLQRQRVGYARVRWRPALARCSCRFTMTPDRHRYGATHESPSAIWQPDGYLRPDTGKWPHNAECDQGQAISGNFLQNRENLSGDCVDRLHAIHLAPQAGLLVMVGERRRLFLVGFETRLEDFRIVILAHGLAALLRLPGARGDTIEQDALINDEFQHDVQRLALAPEHGIQRFRLGDGAREPVEDEAVGRVRLLDPVSHDTDHDLVGNECPGIHGRLRLQPDGGLCGHGGTQHVPGRELRDVVALGNTDRLRSLPGPRRTQQNHSHKNPLDYLFPEGGTVSDCGVRP